LYDTCVSSKLVSEALGSNDGPVSQHNAHMHKETEPSCLRHRGMFEACGTDERLPRHFQSPTYVDSWAVQGLETPPRTFTSHLASNPKRRPTSAQPQTQLSMATCPGQRTMEATRRNAMLQPGARPWWWWWWWWVSQL